MAIELVSVLTRAAAWTAGLIEEVMTQVVGGRPPLSANACGRRSAGELKHALLGRNRKQIVRALGAPPTAAIGFDTVVAGGGADTYWQATTWYYPLSSEERRAIAIRFEGNRAREVDFIGG